MPHRNYQEPKMDEMDEMDGMDTDKT